MLTLLAACRRLSELLKFNLRHGALAEAQRRSIREGIVAAWSTKDANGNIV